MEQTPTPPGPPKTEAERLLHLELTVAMLGQQLAKLTNRVAGVETHVEGVLAESSWNELVEAVKDIAYNHSRACEGCE